MTRPTLSPAKQAMLERLMRGRIAPADAFDSIPRTEASADVPLSFAERGLWFLDRLSPHSSSYQITNAVRLCGQLQVEALRGSLEAVVARHESLRTRFPSVEGWPSRVVDQQVGDVFLYVDMTALPSADREIAARERLSSEARRAFDLGRGPLLRAVLVKITHDEHWFLLSVHHIVHDGRSMEILWRELAQGYELRAQGRSAELPEIPIRFSDYVAWQHARFTGAKLEREVSFWRTTLGDLPPALELPTDRPRSPTHRFAGSAVCLTLPSRLTSQVHALARATQTTPYMVYLSAFQVLLARLSGQREFLVGTPVENRRRPELLSMVGYFANTVVLRASLSGSPSFREHLRRVRDRVLETLSHDELPLEALVRHLQPDRDPASAPLYRVSFGVSAPPTPFCLQGLSSQPLDLEWNVSNENELTLTMFESERTCEGFLHYKTDLFDHATIERWVGHYQVLLEAAVFSPDTPVERLPLLDARERAMVLQWGRGPADEYPRDRCVHELIAAQARETPHHPALVGHGLQRSVTHIELDRRANAWAHALRARGVSPGARVGLFLEPCPDAVVAMLAIWKAGGAYVPLDPGHPPERWRWTLADAKIEVVLTRAAHGPRLREYVAHVLCVDDSVRESETSPPGDFASHHPAYILYTSGSTGRPKGVLVNHRSMVNYLYWFLRFQPMSEGAGAPLHGSLAVDMTITTLWAPLLSGKSIHFLSQAGPQVSALFESVGRVPTQSFVKLTPSHMHVLGSDLRRDGARGWASALIIGGEALRADTLERWRLLAPGTRLVNEYGPTEGTVACCAFDATHHTSDPVPIGAPISNSCAYVLDPTSLELCPVGVLGELFIGGDCLAETYLNRPELTAERFLPNPFDAGQRLYRTGDRARLRADGLLEYLGRVDRQLKVRGHRVEPAEIEAVLAGHPAVREVAVGARGKDREQRLVAYVAPCTPAAPPTLQELRRYAAAFLTDAMLPDSLYLLANLPFNGTGKVDHRALADLPLASDIKSPASVPTTLEAELADLWKGLLHVDEVGVHQDFFELGGHSLLVLPMLARLATMTGIGLPVRAVFEHRTIAALAQEIEARRGDVGMIQEIERRHRVQSENLVSLRQGDGPPVFCVHPMGGTVFCYLPLSRRLRGSAAMYAMAASPVTPDGTHIEVMASQYVEAISRFHDGPICLLGWSMGGCIAFEMAQQLAQAGRPASHLIAIDSSLHSPPIPDGHLAMLLADLLGVAEPEPDAPVEEQAQTLLGRAQKAGRLGRDATVNDLVQILSGYRRDAWALAHYRAQAYAGRVDLIMASESIEGALPQWQSCVADLRTYQAQGDHFSIMGEPHIAHVAKLVECILAGPGATP